MERKDIMLKDAIDFCRECQKGGHTTPGCSALVECNLCGSSDRVFKNCMERAKSYAGVIRPERVVVPSRPVMSSSDKELRSDATARPPAETAAEARGSLDNLKDGGVFTWAWADGSSASHIDFFVSSVFKNLNCSTFPVFL